MCLLLRLVSGLNELMGVYQTTLFISSSWNAPPLCVLQTDRDPAGCEESETAQIYPWRCKPENRNGMRQSRPILQTTSASHQFIVHIVH